MNNFEHSLTYISDQYKLGNDYKEINSFSAMRFHYLLALKEVLNQKNKCLDSEKQKMILQLEKTFVKKIKGEYSPKTMNIKKIVRGLSHSVFKVEGNRAMATCFLVCKNDKYLYFLTNRHVVEHQRILNVVSADGKINLRGKVLIEEYPPKQDMAVIRCTKPSDDEYFTPITFGNVDKLIEGMDIYIFGNRSGLGLGLIKGMLSSFRGDNIMMNMTTEHGTSGSAILDEYGFVVGLNVGDLKEVPYAIHGRILKNYLKSLDIKFVENNNVEY